MHFSILAWKHLSSLVLLGSLASTGLAIPATEAEAGLDLEKRGLLGQPCPEDLYGKWACATNGESILVCNFQPPSYYFWEVYSNQRCPDATCPYGVPGNPQCRCIEQTC